MTHAAGPLPLILLQLPVNAQAHSVNHPHFLVLGAQKAGTTSLYHLLQLHPQVYLPECKEVHYFSLEAYRPMMWYEAHFTKANKDQLCGDITPYYLFHPECPPRIQRVLPNAKLVVLVRDPVDRALSQYFHACRLGFEDLGLEEALNAEEARLWGHETVLKVKCAHHISHQRHSYLSRSRYEQQLRRYLHYFDKNQLMVIRSETLYQDTTETWSNLLDFLELDSIPCPTQLPKANGGQGESNKVCTTLREKMRHQLSETYASMQADWQISWG